jgi:hypothetical protein
MMNTCTQVFFFFFWFSNLIFFCFMTDFMQEVRGAFI